MHFFPVPRVFYRPCLYTSIQHGCKYFDSCVICTVSFTFDATSRFGDAIWRFGGPTEKQGGKRNVLGSGVCVCETNSAWTGYHLRGTCESSPAPRRSPQC